MKRPAELNPYTMNATQRLIRAAETALPLVHPNHYHELAKAIAAAKEEQEGPPIQPPNSIEKAARRIRASAKEDAEGSPHERAVIAAFQDCMGVGGVPSDAEFFEEFTQRLAGQLGIPAADKEGQAKVLTDEEIQRQSEHSGRFLFLSALCANGRGYGVCDEGAWTIPVVGGSAFFKLHNSKRWTFRDTR